MPSKDRVDPKLNEWMKDEGVEAPDPRVGEKVEVKPKRTMSPTVQRLAQRTGVSPDELVEKIPPDTLRRTKYPVIEEILPDGTRTFRHDPGIEDGPRSLVRM